MPVVLVLHGLAAIFARIPVLGPALVDKFELLARLVVFFFGQPKHDGVRLYGRIHYLDAAKVLLLQSFNLALHISIACMASHE